ncbi:MAG: ABC transporter substrate-binding protein [Thermoclostridium sp.]|nr:ABC transporter substrate-binding protein [Thermoclostridium sp.]
MKERIYTIPVSEAFKEDCECPMCLLQKKLEDDALEYTLGPSMMESDHRIETNKKGFCNRHFTKLYNKQKNRLALGLVIDTHLMEQNEILKKMFDKSLPGMKKEAASSAVEQMVQGLKKGKSDTAAYIAQMVEKLSELEKTCTICEKMGFNMGKFTDVILYLFFKEPDFKERFLSKKGFCLYHVKMLLEGTLKYLNQRERNEFVMALMEMEIVHLDRIKEEVNWFTQKFDYRNEKAPWKNSQDAIPRSIEKICGPSDLMR